MQSVLLMAAAPYFFTASAWLLLTTLALPAQPELATYENMVRIPGGTFSMGGDAGLMDSGSQSHQTSYPIHEVTVDAFWMDATEVSNRQFAAFVEATGYVTFAERPLPAAVVASLQQTIAANLAAQVYAYPSGRHRAGVDRTGDRTTRVQRLD